MEKEEEVVEEAASASEFASESASASEFASASATATASASEDESRRNRCLEDGIHFSNSTQVEGGPKGFGLKRWRRIKRDSTKHKDKDADPSPSPDPIRLLKRSSSPNNLVDSTTHAAHADANPFTAAALPLFTPGPADSDNSDDCSSKSSTAASAPKSKHRHSLIQPKPKLKPKTLPSSDSNSSKKHQPHAPSLHYDNPFSSVDSHPTINQTHFTTNNATLDPLVNSIHLLRSAQIALDKEVKRFQELGKEIRLICDDSNEGDRPFDGWASSELNHLYSNNNVGTLETRLSEAEGRLKEREMKIVELEETIKNMIPGQNVVLQRKRCLDMEAELDSILKEKIEAEIEHILITRSSKELSVLVEDEMKFLREQNNDQESKTTQGMEEGENIIKMRRKAVSSAKCFGIQLCLLVLVIALFISQLTPKSAVVVPT